MIEIPGFAKTTGKQLKLICIVDLLVILFVLAMCFI